MISPCYLQVEQSTARLKITGIVREFSRKVIFLSPQDLLAAVCSSSVCLSRRISCLSDTICPTAPMQHFALCVCAAQVYLTRNKIIAPEYEGCELLGIGDSIIMKVTPYRKLQGAYMSQVVVNSPPV